MAKRYDPILCMLVDEPTKAQDELKIVKEDGLWCVYKDGKQVGQSNSEAGAIRIYNRLESGKDSASALDKAIKTSDGMFSKAFGEYSKGAKFKKDKFLKELAGIEDAKEFASKMQTFDNELRKNLDRLDEAYNVAGQDYYSARNEIRSIMDAFSKEAFSLYRKIAPK